MSFLLNPSAYRDLVASALAEDIGSGDVTTEATVTADVRGHGVGKALLADLAQRCIGEGLGRYEWNVLDWNQPSIDFYISQGAVFLDDWRRCRVTGEALMKLGAAA